VADIDLAAIVAEDAKTSGEAPVQEAPAQVDETAEATTAPADEAAEEQPSEAEGEQPQQKKQGGGFQKRISELTREKHEAKREAEQLRELLSKALNGQPTKPAPAAEQSDEPRQDQFVRYEDFVAAKAEWKAEQRVQATLGNLQKQASVVDQEKARIEAAKTFEREAKAQGKAIEGFDEALDTVRSEEFPMTPAVADYLLNADHKAALVKYLADNEDEAYRLSRLGAVAVGRELAKVEMRFASKPKPKTSSAPPPPVTVAGGAAAPQTIERMDYKGVLDLVRQWDQKR